MKGRVVALDNLGGRPAAALLIDGRLEDFLQDPMPEDGPAPETIVRARLMRQLFGRGPWLVELPGKRTGLAKGIKRAGPGDFSLVQVAGFADPGKAVPVRASLSLSGKLVVALPGSDGVFVSRSIRDEGEATRLKKLGKSLLSMNGLNCGLTMRTAAQSASDQAISEEAAKLLKDTRNVLSARSGSAPEVVHDPEGCHSVARREWTTGRDAILDENSGSFGRHGLQELLQEFRQRRVELAGGGSALIETTSAFAAVDVNTGSDVSSGSSLRTNIDLARCLPRQLRIRGLGGQVVIDFVPMAKPDRVKVERELAKAFAEDRTATTLVGWTGLGNFEIHRRKDRLLLERTIPE